MLGVLGKSIYVHGDFLPRHFLGLFTALFAILRMIYLALIVVFCVKPSDYACVIIDGVSAPIPILRWGGYRVMYYCHFPDLVSTFTMVYISMYAVVCMRSECVCVHLVTRGMLIVYVYLV
ncbi:hypothetical protein EON63_14380 [archaeon]|nr:MAG: hypothetical protein EON63_14380 [archaeon]